MKKRDRKKSRTSKSKKHQASKIAITKKIAEQLVIPVPIIQEADVLAPMYGEEAYKFKYVVARNYNDISTIIYASDDYQDAITRGY